MTRPAVVAGRWPISENQRRGLWVTVGKMAKLPGMSKELAEDVLRVILQDLTGQASTKTLTAAQAADVLARLDDRLAAATEPTLPKRDPSTVGVQPLVPDPHRPTSRDGRLGESDAAMVTSEQSGALLVLASALGWKQTQLTTWITGHMKKTLHGRPWPQNRGEAKKCHEGLEAMLWRRPESQPDRVVERAQALLRAPHLSAWEQGFLADVVARQGKLRPAWKRLVKLWEIEKKNQIVNEGGPSNA